MRRESSRWVCWRMRSWAAKPRGMVMGMLEGRGEVKIEVSREVVWGFMVRGEILGLCIG